MLIGKELELKLKVGVKMTLAIYAGFFITVLRVHLPKQIRI